MLLIPSKGRPALRNATADMLVEAGFCPTFVVPATEVGSYRKGNPLCKVEGHPDELQGLPLAMEYALDLVPDGSTPIVFDDDLVLYNRFDGTSRLPRNKPSETQATIRWLLDAAKTHGHATISPTQFNNHVPEDTRAVVAARSVLAFDIDVLRRERIGIARVPSKNDYDITLQLLRKGYANICSYTMCHKQVAGPTLPGGCTPYRDDALHAKASNLLKTLHPDFVRVVEKRKPEWPFPRMDVVVSWNKAYESGLRSLLAVR